MVPDSYHDFAIYYFATNGRRPSVDDIANVLKIDPEIVRTRLRWLYNHGYLAFEIVE